MDNYIQGNCWYVCKGMDWGTEGLKGKRKTAKGETLIYQ
jgi:hypothetical protein